VNATELKRTQRRLDAALAARNASIRSAQAGGMSLRTIATHTGLGVETVRRIVKGAQS